MIVAGILVGIVGGAIGVYALVERGSGKYWFYWIAPFLAIGFAAIMIMLVVQYWMRVGRLEVRGRRKA
jgi:hypothetical protein